MAFAMQQETYVDETLFGRRKSGRTQSAGSAIVHGMQSGRSVVDPGANAAFISRSYLQQMRERANPDAKIEIDRHPPTPARHAAAPNAAMRKTRILGAKTRQLKREAAAAARAEVSREDLEWNIACEARTNPALAAAHLHEVEEYDEIKAFNVKMGKARAMKEVEGQIVDKRTRAQRAKKRVAKIERRMETDRKIALEKEFREVEERRAREKAAADELQAQLEKRRVERLIQEEKLELEGRQLKESIERAIQEEERQAQLKREQAKQVMLETIKANEEHQKLKAARKAREEAQDRALARYQRKKEREEIARLEAEEAVRQEREKLFAKMRAEQERIMDNRGEEDAARARKHQEQRILKEREELAKKEAARKKLYEEVVRDRELQKQFKAERKRREAEIERAHARRARKQFAEARAAEIAEREALIAREAMNQDAVLDQIARRAAAREAEAQVKFRAREAVAKKEAEREVRIKMLKERKRKQLEAEGIGYEAQVRAGLIGEKTSLW